MHKKKFFLLNILFIYFISTSISSADLQKEIINKLTGIKTLSFDFRQKIADSEEVGKCFIKYPLLMKCNYENLKQKTIITNGKTVAIVKKKYKKIYRYPIKTTPLFTVLKKEKIIDLVRKNKPIEINLNIVQFELIDKKKILKIFFNKSTLDFMGWETKDAYSNKVIFAIDNLNINNQILDSFFKIPKEEDL